MNFIPTSTNSRSRRLYFVGLAFVVAILYDIFFWKQEKGLGFLIFVLAYLVLFGVIAQALGFMRQRRALWLAIPIVILSTDVALFNNTLVHNAIPTIVILLLFIFSVLLTLGNPERYKFYFRSIPIFDELNLVFAFFEKWKNIYHDLFRHEAADSGKNKGIVYKKILIGIAISIPILFIFASLFSSADAIFSNWLNKIFSFDLFLPKQISEIIWRIIRTILVTLMISSLFYILINEAHKLSVVKNYSVKKLDSVIVGVVLTLVNLLFLVFVFIQIKYLFGSAEFVLDNKITFAYYARNGFFELVWVMIFSLGMVLMVFRSATNHATSKFVLFLQTLLVVQVMAIAVSALKRMNLYQGEYGYTVKRLYVEWFIYFQMIMMTGIVGCIVFNQTFRHFFYGSLIGGLLALTVVSSVNIDYLIAKKNIDRYLSEGRKLDLGYLAGLSIDTYPQLVRLISESSGGNKWDDRIINASRYVRSDFSMCNRDDCSVLSFKSALIKNRESLKSRYNSWRESNFGVRKAIEVTKTLSVL